MMGSDQDQCVSEVLEGFTVRINGDFNTYNAMWNLCVRKQSVDVDRKLFMEGNAALFWVLTALHISVYLIAFEEVSQTRGVVESAKLHTHEHVILQDKTWKSPL